VPPDQSEIGRHHVLKDGEKEPSFVKKEEALSQTEKGGFFLSMSDDTIAIIKKEF
jgi:hypothetical protein